MVHGHQRKVGEGMTDAPKTPIDAKPLPCADSLGPAMAAAPELLDGCNALLGLIQLWQGRGDAPEWLKNSESHRIEEARAAIAKAERRAK